MAKSRQKRRSLPTQRTKRSVIDCPRAKKNRRNRGDKTRPTRRQRLGMPVSRWIDALMTCTGGPAVRALPKRLVVASKVDSTGDKRGDRSNRLTSYFVSRARLSRYTVGTALASWNDGTTL